MSSPKLHFSLEELQLASQADWILTKNAIIHKVMDQFGEWIPFLRTQVAQVPLPEEVMQTNPKISRGENYRGLPYVMLDYPKFFTKDSVFAIRTFFWWANYLSVTIHLKGENKTRFLPPIMNHLPMLAEGDFFLSLSGDEWLHLLTDENSLSFAEMSEDDFARKAAASPFLKISAKISLSHWNQSDLWIKKQWEILLGALAL